MESVPQDPPVPAVPGWSRHTTSEAGTESEEEGAEQPGGDDRLAGPMGGCPGLVRGSQEGAEAAAASGHASYSRGFLIRVWLTCRGTGLFDGAPPALGTWHLEPRPPAPRSRAGRRREAAPQPPGGPHEPTLRLPEQSCWTTLMLRNIPKCCTRASLTQLLDLAGFQGEYDLVYLPLSRLTCSNLGFAFVNFCNVLASFRFACRFHGVPVKELFPASGSDKVLGVLHAALQIRAAYARLSRSWMNDPRNVAAPTFPAGQHPLCASLLGGNYAFCPLPLAQHPRGGIGCHGYPDGAHGFGGTLDSFPLAGGAAEPGRSRPSAFPPPEGPAPQRAPEPSVPPTASRGTPGNVYELLQEFVVGSPLDSDAWLGPGRSTAAVTSNASREIGSSLGSLVNEEAPHSLSGTRPGSPASEEAPYSLSGARPSSSDTSLMKASTAMSSGSEITDDMSEMSVVSSAADGFCLDDEEPCDGHGILPGMDSVVHCAAENTDGSEGSRKSAIHSTEEAGETSDHEIGFENPVSRRGKVERARLGSREQKPSQGLAWLPRTLLILSGFTLGYVLPVPQPVSVSAKSVSAFRSTGNSEF